jgi:hypothetical protein
MLQIIKNQHIKLFPLLVSPPSLMYWQGSVTAPPLTDPFFINKSKNEAFPSPHMPETWKTAVTYKIQRREVKDFLISPSSRKSLSLCVRPGCSLFPHYSQMSSMEKLEDAGTGLAARGGTSPSIQSGHGF